MFLERMYTQIILGRLHSTPKDEIALRRKVFKVETVGGNLFVESSRQMTLLGDREGYPVMQTHCLFAVTRLQIAMLLRRVFRIHNLITL